MICYMKVLSTLLCLLLLHQNASASCAKGQMFSHNTKKCKACPPKLFSDKEFSAYCENCSECKKGSREVKSCTSTSDAVCKCKEGFTPVYKQNQVVCFCKKGFGIDHTGNCVECMEGFFTDQNDSICKKWRECKSGIEFQGTSTSDVACKDASKEVTERTKAHTTPFQTTTIFSTSTSRIVSPHNNTTKKDNYSLWLIIACPGVILLAGLLYHKCKVTRCIRNHKKVDFRKESVCRKPVEESGEKCLSLLV
ncbi:tumor necrosis factor receptor superfamily member 9 [Puntigrus tetrazona]|uniref:tumor necrosis factor receptor superfamily member 9 n=1 Tax=Puntigrus tetrazona TaxID=1606681 RepID=UPI001C8A71C6|nr:tumor necrosis factor receptor superfamily member 9 [Puntigrus tetrazona]XP_043097951.1 tumor necrosis factor receptor superfamily member 9 [Puntigrus tetrazona]XP_043097952.1 tumor necrosis factor receptor superfamily member 9 [Puntigrus tetrazona]